MKRNVRSSGRLGGDIHEQALQHAEGYPLSSIEIRMENEIGSTQAHLQYH